jgi:hypothetical protein
VPHLWLELGVVVQVCKDDLAGFQNFILQLSTKHKFCRMKIKIGREHTVGSSSEITLLLR